VYELTDSTRPDGTVDNPAALPVAPRDVTPTDPTPHAPALNASSNIDRGVGRARALFAFRPHVLALLLITLFGGILRFSYIDRPPLWGDEAMTYSRVAGTYRELLGQLVKDGFGPLHYSAYWALARVFNMDAFVMRFIPALAGSLMVPAVYFLARQFVSVRTALLASLITACSAYMLVYARDAKMYAHFWLFCTLCMACFLWWMRSGTRLSWLCWVAAGCAMIGTHAPGFVILAIQPLFLLTHAKLKWWKALCFLIGLGVIVSGPVGYYAYFNQFQERTEENWGNSGITWVQGYNAGRTGLQSVLMTTSAFLYSWEWPKVRNYDQLRPWVLTLGQTATWLTLGLLALGAMPWPRAWRGTRGERDVQDPVETREVDSSRDAPNIDPLDVSPEAWWRRLLWLGVWLVLPVYGFYAASVNNPASPLDWIESTRDVVGNWLLLTLGVVLITVLTFVRAARAVCASAVVGGALMLFVGALASVGPAKFFEATGTWVSWITQPMVLLGATPVVLALAWVWSGESTWQRSKKLLQLVVVTAVVVGLCFGIFVAMQGHEPKDVRMPRYIGTVWPALVIVVACLLRRLPGVALRWGAIALLLFGNLFNFSMRIWANSEPPFDRMAADVHASSSVTSNTRTYYPYSDGGAAPGEGDLRRHQGKYHLAIAFGRDLSPGEFRSNKANEWFRLNEQKDNALVSDVKASPHLKRIIVWDRPDLKNPDARDRLLPRLRQSGWTPADEQLFVVRDHWDWREKSLARRRVYERR